MSREKGRNMRLCKKAEGLFTQPIIFFWESFIISTTSYSKIRMAPVFYSIFVKKTYAKHLSNVKFIRLKTSLNFQ